ncbi:MAG: glycosyltransferase family 4 protein, partial [Ilumatobacteraceae bacterium]
ASSYRILAPLLRWLLERVDHKVVVSPDALSLVRRHLGGEYEVLFNGIETEEIRSVPALPHPRPAIFFLGRHEERKGLGVLLEALRSIDLDVSCWVAGVGPETKRLQARWAADDRIEWLGRISDAERNARLRGASVFCAPSLHGESFGVVLLEAMAAGTPVVASDLPGYRNVATSGVDAVLVPPGDPAALADAIRRAVTDQRLATGLRAAGSARADQFAMSTLAERYVAVYERLAA